jgi:hypothetical protein
MARVVALGTSGILAHLAKGFGTGTGIGIVAVSIVGISHLDCIGY